MTIRCASGIHGCVEVQCRNCTQVRQGPAPLISNACAHVCRKPAVGDDWLDRCASCNTLGVPRDVTTFSLAFNEAGLKGTFEPHDECGRAVFPASVHCPDWTEIEVDLDRERDGFRPRQALLALEELGTVPLEWSDGSQTTLAISLAELPSGPAAATGSRPSAPKP